MNKIKKSRGLAVYLSLIILFSGMLFSAFSFIKYLGTAFAWPASDTLWQPMKRGVNSIGDPIGGTADDFGNRNSRDVVGNTTIPATYIYNDGTDICFRMRLNATPGSPGNLGPFGWGAVIDTDMDGSDYEFLLLVKGPNTYEVRYNSAKGNAFSPSDNAETLIYTTQANSTNTRVITAGADFGTGGGPSPAPDNDFFFDFKFNYNLFKSLLTTLSYSMTDNTPIRFILGTSNSTQNLSSDLAGFTSTTSHNILSGATNFMTPFGMEPSTASVSFVADTTGFGTDVTNTVINNTLYNQVNDSDRNYLPSSAQSTTISLSVPGGDRETFTINETGTDTGIFTGSRPTSTSSYVINNGTLEVSQAYLPTAAIATYTDAINGSLNTNVPVTDSVTIYPPPVTTLSTNPAAPDGLNGWFRTIPTVTLTSNVPGTTSYSWNSTSAFSAYTSAFSALPGTNTLYFYSSLAGVTESIQSAAFKVDATSPNTFNLSSPPSGSYTNDTTPTLSWDTPTDSYSGMSKQQLWMDGSLNKDDLLSTAASTSPTTALSDGAHTWNVMAHDNAGNTRASSQTWTINIDTTLPTTSISTLPAAPDGLNGWFRTIPTVTLTSSEPGTTSYNWNSTSSYNTYTSAFKAPVGTNTIYYYSTDRAGNTESVQSSVIKVDNDNPVSSNYFPVPAETDASVGTVVTAAISDSISGLDTTSINTNTFYLKKSGITVSANVTFNEGTGVATLIPGSTLAYNTTYTASLSAGIVDKAGNTLSLYSWSFKTTNDTQKPTATITAPTGNQTLTNKSPESYSITGTANDNDVVQNVYVSIQRDSDSYFWDGSSSAWTSAANTWSTASGTTSWNYTWNFNPSNQDNVTPSYEIRAMAEDTSSNTTAYASQPIANNIKIDNTTPSINSFTINSGSYTNTTAVTLNSDVTDGSPILMRFANTTAGLSSASTQPYNTTAPYNLSAGDGQKWVYSQFRDSPTNADPPNTYNETTAGAANSYDDIILDTTPPTELLKLPASGATGIALGDNITFTFIESNEIDESSIANTGVEGTSTFYIKRGTSWVDATVSYNPATKTAELNPTNNLSGSRTYTVYMTNNVKDKADNYFAGTNWSFTTVNDNEGPDVSITNLSNNQTLTDPTDKTITGTADDSSKGNNLVDNVSIRIKRSDNSYWYGSSWQSTEAWNTATGTTAWSYDWNFDPTNQDGSPSYDITARATDDSPAQNISTTAVNSITIDNTAPVGTFTIGSGNPQYTTSQTNNLYQSVTGATTMAFSNDNNTFTTVSYSGTYNNWSLSAGNGTKTVWARFIDTAANTTNVSDTIIYDDTPPYWWMRTPANGATSVAISTAVKIKINDATSGVDPSSIDENSFYLKRTSDGATISASVTYSGSTKYATLDPGSNLEYNTQYTAYVTSDIKDNAGNTLSPTQWSFTTKQEPQNPSSGMVYFVGATDSTWELDETVPPNPVATWETTKNNGETSTKDYLTLSQWQDNSIDADNDWEFDLVVSNNTSVAASVYYKVGTDEGGFTEWFTTPSTTIDANANEQLTITEYTDSSARTIPSGNKFVVKVFFDHTENNQTITIHYHNWTSKITTSKYFSHPIPVLGTPLLILLALLILYFLYRQKGIEGFIIANRREGYS